MGKMVDDQTANQAGKPLKKGEKKKTHQFWNSRIADLVVFVLYCPFQSVSVS
jgi:hypothetical protein